MERVFVATAIVYGYSQARPAIKFAELCQLTANGTVIFFTDSPSFIEKHRLQTTVRRINDRKSFKKQTDSNNISSFSWALLFLIIVVANTIQPEPGEVEFVFVPAWSLKA